MEAADLMKKTIADHKQVMDDKLQKMYANNRRIIAEHRAQKEEQRHQQ